MDEAERTSRRKFLELASVLASGVVVLGPGSETAAATPPSGELSRTALAVGRLDERVSISTSGPTDVHIHRLVVQPGADSGWHTHPGVALDIVTKGTATAYVDHDGCGPVRVHAGGAYLVPAGVTHLARNEGSEPTEIYVTYIVPAGMNPRVDAEAPGGCRA
jgi:quercetin dioxygenase-like cupin family protein